MMILVWLAALGAPPPEPRTAQAVIAADEAWEAAELHGNSEFLEHLLLPGYVSVAADGRITSREMIVAKARSRRPADLASIQRLMARWRADHPAVPVVLIAGDTAVLRWTLTSGNKSVMSADIFSYVNGQWRAAYSQHTGAVR